MPPVDPRPNRRTKTSDNAIIQGKRGNMQTFFWQKHYGWKNPGDFFS
jgi:hypothetical protein